MQSSFRTWMLPEGVVEALPPEAEKLNFLTNKALSIFNRWGYQPLKPPIVEYAGTFISDSRHDDLDEQTIQFKDQKSGKQLGFRSDMTPQIARIDAHYLTTEKVARYAYAEEVIRSYPTGQNSARNPTVVGAELIGSKSQQADIEIVNLLISFLTTLELPQLTIELGNVDIVIELLKAADIDESNFSHFFEALAIKDIERIEVLCKRNNIASQVMHSLIKLTTCYGNETILDEAQELFNDYPLVNKALSHLILITRTLKEQHAGINFHIDLADVHGYGYHNGLIFSAYIDGVWQAIARGGRYDCFGNDFGQTYKMRPSTGFSCELNLLTPLFSIRSSEKRIICYSQNIKTTDDESLHKFINKLRDQGDIVIESFDDSVEIDQHITHCISKEKEQFVIIAKD